MSVTIDQSGRVVLVTGGTRGIGRGIAEAYLAAGAEVWVCGRKAPETLASHGDSTAKFLTCNVRDPEDVDKTITEIVRESGRLDVLVNNAGGAPHADAATVSPRFTASIIDLNLTSAIHCAQRANAQMQTQESGGEIVNIASVSGTRPSPGTAAYGAAKAGLLNITQSLAVEWAPKVRLNCVTAGLIETELSELHYGDADGLADVAATVPLGRMGKPEDIANACLFLSSPLSSYMSGGQITLDGGGEKPAFLDAGNSEKS